MTGQFWIEPLGNRDRSSFYCGVEPLDRYFQQQVTQDIRRRVSNCFVAVDDAQTIAGYYTFAAAGLALTELSPETAKRLPRYPLLPAALIGRLAIDQRFRRQGLGSALVADAGLRSLTADPAIFALVVDAKDQTAFSFYRHLGFQPFISRPNALFLPTATIAAAQSG